MCYGRSDVGLEPGWEQHLPTCRNLRGITGIVSSPLTRCSRPARWLSERLSLPMQLDERLLELDFGRWEGRSWSEFDGPRARRWAEDPLHRAPPGGESVRAMARRVRQAVAELDDQPRLVLTHGGPLRVLWADWHGLPLRRAFDFQPQFAKLYRFDDGTEPD